MEAMAMGKAIVSTPAGINGLDLVPGKDVIVAGTGSAISQAILELFENPAKRHSLERQARWTVERGFDWDAVARQQLLLYEELIEELATSESVSRSGSRAWGYFTANYFTANHARKRPSGSISSQ
jgi:cation diffusion facilitator CzcD-associated flavoprotein CzcO